MQSSEKQLKVTESDQSMTMINGPTIAFPGLNGLINPLLCLSRAQVKLLRQTRRDRDSQGTRLCKNRSNDFGMSKNWSVHQSFLSRANQRGPCSWVLRGPTVQFRTIKHLLASNMLRFKTLEFTTWDKPKSKDHW